MFEIPDLHVTFSLQPHEAPIASLYHHSLIAFLTSTLAYCRHDIAYSVLNVPLNSNQPSILLFKTHQYIQRKISFEFNLQHGQKTTVSAADISCVYIHVLVTVPLDSHTPTHTRRQADTRDRHTHNNKHEDLTVGHFNFR